MRGFLLACVLGGLSLPGVSAPRRAPEASDPGPRVDAVAREEMARQRIPGLALAVVRHGRVVRTAGYGLANVEHDVPVTPDTVFQSGSVGKQFAAALLLLLADEGRLRLDDPVSQYVEAPARWSGITLRHLLTHTSGIAEYTDKIDLRRDYTEAELVRMAGEAPLDFAPGTRWSCSNTADGALYVSANDLARWALALDTDAPLPAALRRQMWTPARLAGGGVADARGASYGFGWFLRRHNGHELVDHGGSWQGFQAYIGRSAVTSPPPASPRPAS